MKKSRFDQAIDQAIINLEQEKAVLQLAIDKLKAAQSKAPTRKPLVKPPAPETSRG